MKGSGFTVKGCVGLGVQFTDLGVYLNPPKPTFLSGPYKSHIRVYNKNPQKSRFWRVRVGFKV